MSAASNVTSTADLYTSEVPPSTDTSPVLATRDATIPTPRTLRAIRRVELRLTELGAMKSKSILIQKKKGTKRPLDAPQSATSPQKRPQNPKSVPPRNQRPRSQRAGVPSASDSRERSAPRSEDHDEEEQQGQAVEPVSRAAAAHPRIITSVRQTTGPNPAAVRNQDSTLTREMLVEMLVASEKRNLKHMVSQQRAVLEKLQAVEGVLKDLPSTISQLRNSVADVKVMLLPGGTNSVSQRKTGRAPNRTKTMTLTGGTEDAYPTLSAEITIVFRTDVSSIATAKALGAYMVRFHNVRDSVAVSSRAMNLFLYSPEKGKGKHMVTEGIGYRHGEFRFKAVKYMLQLAKNLPDSTFSTHVAQSISAGSQEANVSIEGKPSWLRSDLVNLASLTLARKHHEWFVSQLPKDPTDPVKRKALYIAKAFLKQIVDMLRLAREKSKGKMYEDGLYLLLGWESLSWISKELHNPILTFPNPDVDPISPCEIQDCAVGILADVRETKAEFFQTLISEREEMVVEATYDVFVSKEATAQARKNDKDKVKKTITRIVNILRVAKSFMCGFCHLSEEDLVRSHPAMLQCMYRLALILRDIFVEHAPPSKMYVRAIKTKGRGQGSVQQTSQRSASPVRSAGREQTQSENNGNGAEVINGDNTPGSGQGEMNEGRDDDQHSSPNRSIGEATERADRDARKGTPPVKLPALLPAYSEMDRILGNYTELSVDAYERMNIRRHEDQDGNYDAPVQDGEDDDQQDSDRENGDMLDMRDMLGDDE